MADTLRELDVRIARDVMGRTVLGMAACQENPDCCACTELAWSSSRESFDRPVMLAEWEPFPSAQGNTCDCLDDIRDDDPLVLGHSKYCRMLEIAPRYSSSLTDAMTVAERVGGRLELDGYHGQGWTATLRGQRYFAPTPAEAICRAALLAVGSERQGRDDREATT